MPISPQDLKVYAADGGGTDAYAITLTGVNLSAYADIAGIPIVFKANTANTGAASLNINSKGAIAIKKETSAGLVDLADNDIRAGQAVVVAYDGAVFQMVSAPSTLQSIVYSGVCQGRLTNISALPVDTLDRVAQSILYFTPYLGDQIGLYDGAKWVARTFSEASIKLADTQNGNTTNASAIITNLTDTSQFIVGMQVSGAGIPAATTITTIDSGTQVTMNNNATATASGVSLTFKVPQFTLLDIFGYDNNGSLKLEMVRWNSTSGIITGATNASPIVITSVAHGRSNGALVGTDSLSGNTAPNGVISKLASVAADTFALEGSTGNGAYISGGTWTEIPNTRATALTNQNGIPSKSGALTRRYLGTIMTTSLAGETENSFSRRLIWNYYNRVQHNLRVVDIADSWTYDTTAYRQADNKPSNRVLVVSGYAESALHLELSAMFTHSGAAGVRASIGQDSTISPVNGAIGQLVDNSAGGVREVINSMVDLMPAIGCHFYQWLEYGNGATTTFYGDNGDSTLSQSGMTGSFIA